jgi:hypothetical protein
MPRLRRSEGRWPGKYRRYKDSDRVPCSLAFQPQRILLF